MIVIVFFNQNIDNRNVWRYDNVKYVVDDETKLALHIESTQRILYKKEISHYQVI